MADFEDEFVDAENTEITAHTPDVGTGWTKEVGTGTDNFKINAANQIKAGSASNKDVIIGDDLASADMQIWMFFPAASLSAPNSRVCARLDGGNDSYAGGVTRDSPNFELTTRNAGSTSVVGSGGDPSVDTWIKIKCEGDTITWFHAQQTAEPADPESDVNWTQLHQETGVTIENSEVSHGFFGFGTDLSATDVDPLIGSYRASTLASGDVLAGDPVGLIHEL